MHRTVKDALQQGQDIEYEVGASPDFTSSKTLIKGIQVRKQLRIQIGGEAKLPGSAFSALGGGLVQTLKPSVGAGVTVGQPVMGKSWGRFSFSLQNGRKE